MDPKTLPVPESVVYAKFTGGLDLSDAPEGLELDRSTFALDMEVTRNDRIVRSPGVSLVEEVSPHSLMYIIPQASIDYTTDIVVIDPPYIGIKSTGPFTWYNVGLNATAEFGWPSTNVIGDLIFSNGFDSTYVRQSGATVVSDISADIIATSFAVAFGRAFAGGYMSAGTLQGLGIRWNASTGAVNDWIGVGSGAEFLLSSNKVGDKIIGMEGIGFDYLGIMCRNSLWIGTRTGQPDRPADFRERFPGLGCASRDTIAGTPNGVMFLSDEGVVLFNANNVDIISGQINAELLPLDYVRINSYKAVYQARLRRYVLTTPLCTWIYEEGIPGVRLPRWFKRSLIADNIFGFADQSGIVSWEDVVGTWEEQTLGWEDLSQSQTTAPARLYVTSGTKLGVEDVTVTTNFGSSLQPKWRPPNSNKVQQTDMFTTVGFEVEYVSSVDSVVNFVLPDNTGQFTNNNPRVLPASGDRYVRRLIEFVYTGLGVAGQIEIYTGDCAIAHVRQIYQSAGPDTAGDLPVTGNFNELLDDLSLDFLLPTDGVILWEP